MNLTVIVMGDYDAQFFTPPDRARRWLKAEATAAKMAAGRLALQAHKQGMEQTLQESWWPLCYARFVTRLEENL